MVAAALAAALAGCGGDGESEDSSSPDRFDSAAAIASIERQVAVGQRPAGSPQLRELADELRAELPNGRFEPVPGHPGLRNVVGTLPGPGPAIVIAAHYDTEADPPGFVGANDGAAGTAAVIELARALERELPDGHREVRFVLFDGEEEPRGCPDARFEQCALRGSKAYAAAHGEEIGRADPARLHRQRGAAHPARGQLGPGAVRAAAGRRARGRRRRGLPRATRASR